MRKGGDGKDGDVSKGIRSNGQRLSWDLCQVDWDRLGITVTASGALLGLLSGKT